jgi:hypothetical protein
LQVPFWFSELHVAVALVSLSMLLTGVVLVVRD